MLNRVFSACLAVAGLCCLAAQAQTLPPAEGFGRLPLTSEPKLSPDGKHFAVVQAINGRPAVVIYDTAPAPGSKPSIITGGEAIIADARWAKNDRLILFVKHGYTATFDKLRTWMRTVSVNIKGNEFAPLLRNMPAYELNTSVADIIDINLDDPDYTSWGCTTRSSITRAISTR